MTYQLCLIIACWWTLADTATTGLTVLVYNNTALAGPAEANYTIGNLENVVLSSASSPLFSAEILGTLTLDINVAYVFDCAVQGALDLLFLHVDDRLMCQSGAYSGDASDPALWALTKSTLTFRLTAYHASTHSAEPVAVTVRWSATARSPPTMTKLSNAGYTKWLGWNIDTPGHSMANKGGDLANVTVAQCEAYCEDTAGCMGFVRSCGLADTTAGGCYLRQLAANTTLCKAQFDAGYLGYTTWTRNGSCEPFNLPAQGGCSPPAPPPAPAVPIDPARLSPGLMAPEISRRALQKSLAVGWGQWYQNNILRFAKLPDGLTITVGLCRLSTQQCLNQFQTDEHTNVGGVRVGLHAYNHAYMQLYFWMGNMNVSISLLGGGDLTVLVEPVLGNNTLVNVSDYAVQLEGSNAWFRAATVVMPSLAVLTLQPYNLPEVTFSAATDVKVLPPAAANITSTSLLLPLSQGAVAASTNPALPTLAAVAAAVAAAEAAELATYTPFGPDAELKAAIQTGLMWNLAFTPIEYGPFFPVAKGWNFANSVNADFNYVIFDWDNIFASHMLSLDAKNWAYSNLIQVIKSKTSDGFVPNFAAATRKSLDRTEPPIGAKVLLEMFQHHNESWIVENNWFVAYRTLPPLGLISLGGDQMQGARYESGLDNSPMYDGEFWNASTTQMELYDVGMTSMFVSEALALADLASIIGRPEEPALRARAAAMTALLTANLWDDVGSIYTNKFPNNTFYRRISPTSFYALLTGGPTDAQAAAMASGWLLNVSRFCLDPHGDPSGHDPNGCYWGLPSISADDPAFPPLGYWRGYVWGPMAQLVWWSLRLYDHVPEVHTARLALTAQMGSMFLDQFRRTHHVCENFSPHFGAPDCTGDLFYHWGALTAFLSLQEHGWYV